MKAKSATVIMVKVPADYTGVSYAFQDADGEKKAGGRDTIGVTVRGVKATRTAIQNNALHKYFDLLSEKLNAAGWDMKAVMEKLSKNAKIPWSPLAIKERLWRPVQLQTYGTESTTKLDTNEVSVVYEALNQVTASMLGESIPFPDKYSLMDSKLDRNAK